MAMKLYQLWSDHTYRAFETKEKDEYKIFSFRGAPISDWTDVTLYPSMHRTEIGKEIGDVLPVDISAVVVNERCFNIIKPYIQDAVQVLSAKSKKQKLFVLNVTAVRDCLDYENSKLKRFSSSGRIMRIEEYVFHKELLENVFIFKIPEEVHTHPYVTDSFKCLIEQNEIKGFKFVPIWQDE